MALNMIPKFGKVEILLKSTDNESISKLEFDDSGLVLSGDYLVVVIDEKDELENTLSSTGKIFSLKDISAYKTYSA